MNNFSHNIKFYNYSYKIFIDDIYFQEESKKNIYNNKMSRGLILNEKKITEISGPASCYILKPKKQFIKEALKYNIYAPIFILFGDIHGSLNNECLNCVCKKDEKCCMKIYNKEFIKMLSDMSSDKYPVDFFIEGLDLSTLNIDNIPLKKNLKSSILKTSKYIYDLKLKKTFKFLNRKSLKKTIRFHLIDPRRHHSFENKYQYENKLSLVSEIYEIILEENKLKEAQSRLKDIFEYSNMNNIIKNYYDIYLTLTKNILYNKESVINKEIRKINKYFIKKWIKYINEYISWKLKEFKIDKKEFNSFLKKFGKISEYINNGEITEIEYDTIKKILEKESYIKFHGYMILLDSLLLDIYYLSRSFKKPFNNINGILNICYTGAAHTSNIKYFLSKILKGYKIVFEQKRQNMNNNLDTEKYKRCIVFNKEINLNKMIKENENLIKNVYIPKVNKEKEEDKKKECCIL